MYQDMVITLPATSGLPLVPESQPSNLPPYTPTPSDLSLKFELSYASPTEQNPIVPIYRSQNYLAPLDDGSPPQYQPSLRSTNSKPAYFLQFDSSTQDSMLMTTDGVRVASVSFVKLRKQTITTFGIGDPESQTLASSSATIGDDEGTDIQVLLRSETLSNEEFDERVQEEVGSVLLDTGLSAKETVKMSSHKYFHPKGTSFKTDSGYIYRWQKSISASSPPLQPSSGRRPPHSTFLLTQSVAKDKTAGRTNKVVGRISISQTDASKAVLDMKEGQEGLSEVVFLGSAIAMLKKVEWKAARQKAAEAVPRNTMQMTF